MAIDERRKIELSAEEFERLAQRAGAIAKESALQDIYIAVGKSVISKILWVLGAAAAALAAWFNLKST